MISKFVGLALILASLTVVFLFETSGSGQGVSFQILHWPAIVLTGVGPFGLVLICSEWQRIRKTLEILFSQSPATLQRNHDEESEFLKKLSIELCSRGMKTLDSLKTDGFSVQVRKTLSRLAIRMPVSDVRHLVERDQDRACERLSQSIGITSLGVRFSPSIGMLGTILGMVQLLSHLKDPSNIGSYMSLALLTTFYGLFFSLVLWTPIQHRLEAVRDLQLEAYDQLLHWLELLEKRKPTQYFSEAHESQVEKN